MNFGLVFFRRLQREVCYSILYECPWYNFSVLLKLRTSEMLMICFFFYLGGSMEEIINRAYLDGLHAIFMTKGNLHYCMREFLVLYNYIVILYSLFWNLLYSELVTLANELSISFLFYESMIRVLL